MPPEAEEEVSVEPPEGVAMEAEAALTEEAVVAEEAAEVEAVAVVAPEEDSE